MKLHCEKGYRSTRKETQAAVSIEASLSQSSKKKTPAEFARFVMGI
jgi:hypothetical protein